jgi:hypothetical protein
MAAIAEVPVELGNDSQTSQANTTDSQAKQTPQTAKRRLGWSMLAGSTPTTYYSLSLFLHGRAVQNKIEQTRLAKPEPLRARAMVHKAVLS